jgi:hypothetical protein
MGIVARSVAGYLDSWRAFLQNVRGRAGSPAWAASVRGSRVVGRLLWAEPWEQVFPFLEKFDVGF